MRLQDRVTEGQYQTILTIAMIFFGIFFFLLIAYAGGIGYSRGRESVFDNACYQACSLKHTVKKEIREINGYTGVSFLCVCADNKVYMPIESKIFSEELILPSEE